MRHQWISSTIGVVLALAGASSAQSPRDSDCYQCQFFHEARIVGPTDDRKVMTPEIEERFTGLGFFALPNIPSAPQASGFLVESNDLVLTNAHVFTTMGKWNGFVSKNGKDLRLNQLGFFIKKCNKLYSIASVNVQTFRPEAESGKDIALVKLKDPVCSAARPLRLRVASTILIENMLNKPRTMSIAGIYDLNDLPDTASDSSILSQTPQQKSRSPKPVPVYMDCNLTSIRWADGAIVFEHNCDTTEGGSGGPAVVALASGTYAFGVHKGFVPGSDDNLGIFISQSMLEWIQGTAKAGTLRSSSIVE